MKKKKDPLQQRWKRLRAAIRNVWQYDMSRKRIIQRATENIAGTGERVFTCPLCNKEWPIDLATVDHEPELGGFDSWEAFFDWTRRCFEGPMRAICKPCHKHKKRPKRVLKKLSDMQDTAPKD